MQPLKYKKGLVIGKFMPPHKGHEYLFNFAKEWCDELIIVVDNVHNQIIPPEVRKSWIKEDISNVTVVALPNIMPQEPDETPDFWDIWRNALLEATDGGPDVLIASMDYGWKLSDVLDCAFIECDISRKSIDICATSIRENVLKYWNYLMPSAKSYFLKKVCLIGPESTGKTTLAEFLAQNYNTVTTTEYAAKLIKSQNGHFYENDVLKVAYAQIRMEKALEKMTNKFMVCDSDVLTTMVWSDVLFGTHPEELDVIAGNQHYDITFLMYPDVDWVSDLHRECLDNGHDITVRLDFFHRMKYYLEKFNRPYVVLKGDYSTRYQEAISFIDTQILENGSPKLINTSLPAF